MLMSARVLTYFLDLMPRAADRVLVKHGAVEALCGPLMEIEYLDVAEQCLEAFEKLSRTQSVPCLKAGVINSVLSFMDFLELSAQRIALSTVTNACENVPEDCFSIVMDAVPTLCNLLDYQDRKLVESTAMCLMRIVENFGHSSELLDELCKHGVVKQSVKLISAHSPMALSETTYIGMIELLVRLANRSLLSIRSLYESNINSILESILRSPDLSRRSPPSHCEDISRDQVYVALKLLNQLIPPVARDEQDIQLVLGKEKIIIDEPKLSFQFAVDILPALIQAVTSGANACIHYACVSVIKNYVSIATPDMLRALIKNANMPKFLAGLLSRKDHHVLIPALNVVEIIMKKLPGELVNSFVKEGVSHAIRALSKQDGCSQSQLMDQQSSNLGDTDERTAANLSRCLCYAFDPSSSPSSESKMCRLQRHILPPLAQHIMSAFFSESLISSMELSENLQKLKSCCIALDKHVNSALTNCDEREDYLSQMLVEAVTALNEGDSISTFEFIESGFIRFLARYLTNGEYLHRALDSDMSVDYLTVLKRLQTFSFNLLAGHSGQHFPLTSLVQHLQNALSSLECFPVVLSAAYKSKSRSTDIPDKSSTKHPCLQVHFVTEEGETDLRLYDNVLTVDISSSYDAIEEFLWPKVKKKTAFAKKARAALHHIKQTSRNVDSEERVGSSTAQSNEGDITRKLIFLLNGKQLDRSVTLYQAILQDKINEDPDIIVSKKFWDEVHRVTLRSTKKLQLRSPQISADPCQSSLSCDKTELSWHNFSFFSTMLLTELPLKLERSNPAYDALFVLKILEGLNRVSFQLFSNERSNAFAEGTLENFDDLKVIAHSLPQTEFISSKLTSKLEQQMHDHLALSTATMPLWCMQLVVACPFLFSFEARWKYFCLNISGVSRNQTQNSEKNEISTINDRRSLSASLPRKRFKVHRNNILASAAKMMQWYAGKKVLLEIEFSNEVGTGLGPTLEFYTLVSHVFQKVGMCMWRGDHTSTAKRLKTSMVVSDSGFIIAHSGLFPRPWSSGMDFSNGVSFSKVLKNFFLLGQLTARAIQDGRILDLPFSRAFYKLMLEQDLDIYDIQSFDPELGRTLIEFQALAKKKGLLESKLGEHSKDRFDPFFRNTRIEDLCLDFSLPGYPDYVFSSRGDSKMVNISNLEEYVSLVVDATVRRGISRQLESFKSGFSKVFPIKALQIFTAEELERLLCGEQDNWDIIELQNHINFDHGYSSTSRPAMKFLEIIQEFDPRQRRAFLLFVTGAPRLPPGGLAALKPKLTIVCKHCDNDADMELPSVMTCANYLKLPPYSSKERMMEKILYAIREGQGAFHLS